jgi:membrane associated rhomboid family serine protease
MADEVSAPSDLKDDRDRLAAAFLLSAGFAILLWLVMIVQAASGLELSRFGVYPGRVSGLVGVLAAPFIHGSAAHLVSNTLPIVILGTALLYGYPKASRIVLPALFLLSGLGVWLFGRQSYHIGASGLTVGMMFFVFTIGALRWDRRAIGLACIVFFMYGGMVWGVFPTDPQISFESHLSGAVAGVALALLLRNLDPAPPAKRYSWEREPEEPFAHDAYWQARPAALHVATPGGPAMDIETLRRSLGDPSPPPDLSPALRALWHLGRNEWDAAHAVVQDAQDAASAWVHAHLHRVEGDLSNARYWYARAQQPESTASLDEEWQTIVAALLGRARP